MVPGQPHQRTITTLLMATVCAPPTAQGESANPDTTAPRALTNPRLVRRESTVQRLVGYVIYFTCVCQLLGELGDYDEVGSWWKLGYFTLGS